MQNDGAPRQSNDFAFVKIAIVTILASVLCGCGVGAGASSSASSGNSGVLSLSSSALDFGTVQLGSTSEQSVTLSNTGSTALSLSNTTTTGRGFLSSGITTPLTLNPAQTASLNMTFAPTTAGVVTGTLMISTDKSGIISVSLTGVGQANATAHLSASPSSVKFGSVGVGSSNSQAVTFGNSGTAGVTISSVSFEGAGFNVTGTSTPLSLQPGQTSLFSVGFNPSSVGAVAGNVFFKDSVGTTLLAVPLSGSAVAALTHSVDLTWSASSSSVSGYRVYRSLATGGPYSLLTPSFVQVTSFQDTSVLAGKTYFYVVTAVDATNVESGYSNEVAAVIPVP